MRRWMAFLLVLGALVAPLAPAALGQDGATYTSPTYGYAVHWDPTVWREVPEAALTADGPDALDRLRLENPAGSLYVEGARRYGGAATSCSADELALFTRSPDVSDVQIRTDLAASGPDRSVEAAEGTLALEGGESIRLAIYVDCRRLSPEATLFATVIAPAAVFAPLLPSARDVIEAIELSGGTDPEAPLFQALREAEANGPAAGPLDGVLEPAVGSLAVLDAGVDLADFAATATFATPDPVAGHPFDIGFGFRQAGGDEHLRLVVDSDGVWYLKNGLGPVIASGRVDGLRTGDGETNTVELIARGETGAFAVNSSFVADLDLSARGGSGDVFAGAGFFVEDALAGRTTEVNRFTVWPLVSAAEPVSLDEASFAALLDAARQGPPLSGPQAGALTQVEGAAALAPAGVDVADFAARVRWANPETRFWDVGVAFRDQPDGRHYRLTFDQTGGWSFGIGLEPKLATGGAASMKLGPGAVNTVEVLVVGRQTAFSVNGVFVALLDVSAIGESGDVWFGSGFNAANVTPGAEVRFRDLTVWAPPPPGAGAPPETGGERVTEATLTTVAPPPTAVASPTAEPLPTVEPSPTAEPLPILAPRPTSAPLPAPPAIPTASPTPPPSSVATPASLEPAASEATPIATTRRIVAVRVAEIAGSGVQGLATVTEVAGTASVQLVVEGAAGDETAAIYAGACDDLPAEPFVRLTDPDTIGRSRTLLDVPVADIVGGDLVLAVFAGDESMNDLVACGPIGG